MFARLVPDGSGRKVTTVTNGGRFFVDFHWTFNREVEDLSGRTFKWTYMLSGFVGMAFLICTITGPSEATAKLKPSCAIGSLRASGFTGCVT